MYHIFSHSSVDGHLVCFHVLTVVNSAALDVEVHASFCYCFVWVYAQDWDCWILWNLFFSFLRNLLAFSTVDVSVNIPTNSVGGFPFFPYPPEHLLFVDF